MARMLDQRMSILASLSPLRIWHTIFLGFQAGHKVMMMRTIKNHTYSLSKKIKKITILTHNIISVAPACLLLPDSVISVFCEVDSRTCKYLGKPTSDLRLYIVDTFVKLIFDASVIFLPYWGWWAWLSESLPLHYTTVVSPRPTAVV